MLKALFSIKKNKTKLKSMRIYSVLFLFILFLSCSEKEDISGTNQSHEKAISELLSKMTIEEKIGQTNLGGTSSRSKILSEELKESVRKGNVGAFLNVMNVDYVDELQKIGRASCRERV